MKIFVIDFSDSDELSESFPENCRLSTENKDGALAYQQVGEQLPEKIFINYSHKPSHGRQTALSIKNRKKTAHIPIYFVDGTESENEKVKHLGHCIRTAEVLMSLGSSLP